MKIVGRRAPPAPDAAVIRTLASLLAETGLTEIEYAVGDTRIRLARGPAGAAASPPVVRNGVAAPAATNGAAPHEPPASEKPATNGANHPGALTSPIVGIAYLAPEPGSPPFVTPGQTVTAGQTLMLIEAMKTFNQIKAPKTGTVTRILVESGSPVEYSQPLLILE